MLPYLLYTTIRGQAEAHPGLRAVALVRPENAASLHSVAKLGFRVVGSLGFVEVFGARLHFLRPRGILTGTGRRTFLALR